MAKSKDDIKYGTAQAKLSEDETLRTGYKHGAPLEGGKIADSEPVALFSSAHNISDRTRNSSDDSSEAVAHTRLQREPNAAGGNATSSNTTSSG